MKKLTVWITLALAACSPKSDDADKRGKAESAAQEEAEKTGPESDPHAGHEGHGDEGNKHGEHVAHDGMKGHAGMDHGSLPAGEIPETSIYNLETKWTTEDGETAQLSDFKGNPTVLLMFYATCQSACPVLITDIKRMDEKLSDEAREKTQFVLVSFDPETDSVEDFKKLEKSYEMDEDRYTFLHGTSGEVRALAAVLGVQYRERANGHFTHTNLITLLDPSGVVEARSEGLRQSGDEIVSSIEKMTKGSN